MFVCKWEKLPPEFQMSEVRPYWEKLRKKNFYFFWKRLFDILFASFSIIILCPLFLVVSLAIKMESKGPVFYRQERITQYGKTFYIHKFRSMLSNSDKSSLITIKNDDRITSVGKIIRKFKIDELGQIIDIFLGNMTLVGTRPEVKKYVNSYTSAMMSTLLIPAGLTSTASILFKDENSLFDSCACIDDIYLGKILPIKMEYNLNDLSKSSIFHDTKILFLTFFAVIGIKIKTFNYFKQI